MWRPESSISLKHSGHLRISEFPVVVNGTAWRVARRPATSKDRGEDVDVLGQMDQTGARTAQWLVTVGVI